MDVAQKEANRIKRLEAKAQREEAAEALAVAERRIFDIEQMRRGRNTKPTRFFAVGDRVSVGNHGNMVIKQVFDDGMFYECHFDYMGEEYGRPVRMVGDQLWHWYSIAPYRDRELDDKNIPQFSYSDETRLSFSQRQLDGLIHCYYRWNIDMSPEYQRGNVWTQADKELLIESIFENRDIGKFVVIMRPYAPDPAPHAEILDGKQRLTTLVEFFEGRIKYKGMLFQDMHWRDQAHFRHYSIGWAELGEKTTRKQKLTYFLKLNVTGVPQDPAHIESVRKLLEDEK